MLGRLAEMVVHLHRRLEAGGSDADSLQAEGEARRDRSSSVENPRERDARYAQPLRCIFHLKVQRNEHLLAKQLTGVCFVPPSIVSPWHAGVAIGTDGTTSTTTNHSDEPFPEEESSGRLWSELMEAVRKDDGACAAAAAMPGGWRTKTLKSKGAELSRAFSVRLEPEIFKRRAASDRTPPFSANERGAGAQTGGKVSE